MTGTQQRNVQEILAAVREVEAEAAGGAEALFMAALLAPSPLPYDFALGMEGTLHNPSLINPAAAFFAATAVMEPLILHGLAETDVENQTFTLPDDVRRVILDSLSEPERRTWAGRAVYALNLVLPDVDEGQWEVYEWLMPHIQACLELVEMRGLRTEAANRVLHQTGFALHYQGRHREGAAFLDAALAVDVDLKGAEHPDICNDLEGLATVLWAAQDPQRAERAFASCLELQKRIFTENNPITAPILNSLGVIRQALGRLNDAEAAFRECLRVLTQAHGEGHPAIASCLSNYALLCEAADRPDEALRLAERALEINRSFRGDDDPEVAADLNTVALLLARTGKLQAAEAHFRESLAVREKHFGPDHAEVGQSLCNLALLLHQTGHPEQAAPLYERGLLIYDKAIGATHPLMQSALDNYLLLLKATGTRPQSDRLLALADARPHSNSQTTH
ncbi:tetratricopeptide repeat protein [Pseudodesulfovibrio sp.]|uniref:tetratricopeptide repeat protein n=1 Tax=unclassified Pseudodesulfovibrio TaxID=2661612 RepID=UPI003B00922B